MRYDMKEKVPFNQALGVATELCVLLTPHCERINICGSLRRNRPIVSDIELLFIPKLKSEQDGLFDTKSTDLADVYIETLFNSGLIGKRLNSAGYVSAWGPKNKLGIHTPSGIPVDFFSTTTDAWWVSLVIRTGSKETNLRLTTGAQGLHRTLHAYGSGVEIKATGEHIAALSERDVFNLCGVDYLEPDKR